jgi:hypothetical protein
MGMLKVNINEGTNVEKNTSSLGELIFHETGKGESIVSESGSLNSSFNFVTTYIV